MKLTDKRFWNGEETVYYPSFKHALTDSLLWSILGIGVICLLLSVVCLTIYFIDGDNLSWDDISYFFYFPVCGILLLKLYVFIQELV